MHGMINRAIQCFLRDTYGADTWSTIVQSTDLGLENFEAMLEYDDSLTISLLSASARHFKKPVESFLEDLGTYLVSHPNVEAIRRLLRFGGSNYAEFLFSLNELQGRAHMALPDIQMPQIKVSAPTEGRFSVMCSHDLPGFGYVLVGVLRAMADDYGALVLLEHQGWADSGQEVIEVHLLEAAFSEGRAFSLVQGGLDA